MHQTLSNREIQTRHHLAALAQVGSGLVRMLILLIVILAGALAFFGLLGRGEPDEAGGLSRSIAVMGAYSIIDALRADRAAAIGGAFNLAPEAPIGTHHANSASRLTAWRDYLVQLLGDGASGGVRCEGRSCVVTVHWIDRQPHGQMAQHIETEVLL